MRKPAAQGQPSRPGHDRRAGRASSCSSPARSGGRAVDRLAVVRRGRLHRACSPACCDPDLLFLVFGLAMALFVGGNLYLAYRLRPLLRRTRRSSTRWSATGCCCARGSACGSRCRRPSSGCSPACPRRAHWQQWLLFLNARPFGVTDPQFGMDVGFYIFEYPFWRYLLGVGFTAMVLALLGALAVHYLYGGVRLQGAGDRMTTGGPGPPDRAGRAFVLLKAAAYFLDRRALLLEYNSGTDALRRRLHRRQRAAAGQGDPGLHLDRGRGRDPGVLQRVHAQPGVAGRRRWPCSASPRSRSAASTRGGADVHGQAEPARQGGAVHPAQHRRHPGGVRARPTSRSTAYPASNQTPPASLATDTDGRAEHPPAGPGRGR